MNTEVHRCYQYHDENRAQRDVKVWENTNVLLKEGWEGIKTGQTITAGNCLASLRDGVYIVVLNCPDSAKRFTETKRLFSWYSEKLNELASTLSTSSESF
jgi:D-alanyl-D-alanine carboxypeptidase